MAMAVFDGLSVCKDNTAKLRARSLSSRAPYGHGDILRGYIRIHHSCMFR